MKKKLLAATAVLCAVALLAVIIADFLYSKNNSSNFISMNTTVSLDITGIKADEAAEKMQSEINRLDSELLSRTNSSSEIFAVNSGRNEVSDELAKLLTDIKAIEQNSGNTFCSALGSLTDLWGIGTESEKLPAKSEIDSAIIGAADWSIAGNNVNLPEGIKLDLGAVGKGIACDYAAGILTELKCSEAIVAVGGSVLLYTDDDSESFKVGIRNPLGQATDHCAIIETSADFVSTSGNYERFFEDENGNRYHHIFDPSTGYPAESGLISVTVIAPNGMLSDALSTACFVLGIEKSLPLLEKYSADAVFITEQNEIITTFDDNSVITITDDNFTLGEAK